MLRFLADENLKREIVSGLRARQPALDVVRVQDVGLRRADDPTILAWAAKQHRVVLTHDVRTMTRFAYDRARAGLPMPGVIEVRLDLPIGRAIDELLLVAELALEEELEGQVRYVPL